MFGNLIKKAKKFMADDLDEAGVLELVDIFCNPDAGEGNRMVAKEKMSELSSLLSDMDTSSPETIEVANQAFDILLGSIAEVEDEENWFYEGAMNGLTEIANISRYELDKGMLESAAEIVLEYFSEEEVEEVRSAAISMAGSLADVVSEEANTRSVHELVRYIDQTDSDSLRADFIFGLGIFGRRAGEFWDLIGTYLHDRSAKVRNRAASALWMVGSEQIDPAVIERLIELLETDDDSSVRENCASCLGHLGSGFPGVVPALIRALDGPGTRHWAIFALNDLAYEAGDAVPYLESIMVTDEEHAEGAVMALQSIATPEAHAVLEANGHPLEM